ncbi:MAG: superinfection exclusion B family protein [Planctomycetes bacterium]|nr:superinfection exclusion B family protein [Planctomycetota bacterium]
MDVSAGLAKLFDALKLSTVPATAGAVLTGTLLFGPTWLIDALGMTETLKGIRPWVGLGFLLCAAVLLTRASVAAGGWVRKRWTWWANERNLRKRLNRLAPDEKETLSRFLLERRKCLKFPMDDGVSQGLAASTILFRSSTVGDMLTGFDFSIQPWAWQYLNKHPELVISDPRKLALLIERTAMADAVGFEEGRAPWEDQPPARDPFRRRMR